VLRNTITNEIFEVYPVSETPSSKQGKATYDRNWRRKSPSKQTPKTDEAK
tara:strand:- start:802 stop:951 length:150 start_codon:yes stop_codon:yes gene_type:complete